ncbi:MAG: polysaccharide deacetylase family protein [Bacteroidetes bacterium]|nr:polysaccharide deacetylase family protein [Bacteroidota bacterium]
MGKLLFVVLKRLFTVAFFCFWVQFSSGQAIDNAAVLTRKQVPILCYHQIRDWRPGDKQIDKDYIIPPATFKAHMKMLADSGYHTILPDQLYEYLVNGSSLPDKPILLTFDDDDEDGFKVARPELIKYGFKGVFFIVTTNIEKNKYYMDGKQLKQLSDEGNVIACHTRDHVNFKKLKGGAWEVQVDKPAKKLEAITGKPVKYFAFPYGLWNSQNLPELHRLGFAAAFQLTDARDPGDPLMTIRRLIDCGYWDAGTLDYNIKHDFGRVKKEMKVTAQLQPKQVSGNPQKRKDSSRNYAVQ